MARCRLVVSRSWLFGAGVLVDLAGEAPVGVGQGADVAAEGVVGFGEGLGFFVHLAAHGVGAALHGVLDGDGQQGEQQPADEPAPRPASSSAGGRRAPG